MLEGAPAARLGAAGKGLGIGGLAALVPSSRGRAGGSLVKAGGLPCMLLCRWRLLVALCRPRCPQAQSLQCTFPNGGQRGGSLEQRRRGGTWDGGHVEQRFT